MDSTDGSICPYRIMAFDLDFQQNTLSQKGQWRINVCRVLTLQTDININCFLSKLDMHFKCNK